MQDSIINHLRAIKNKIAAKKYQLAYPKDAERIKKLKNKHNGDRCFVIGMGPSLSKEDLDLIKDEYSFGCNKCYLIFDETEWRPTYYSVADHLVVENVKEEILKIVDNENIVCIFDEQIREQFKENLDITYVKQLGIDDNKEGYKFSDNLLRGFYSGTTVSYRMLQMAAYMGFKEIIILGMDFSFAIPEKKIQPSNEKVKDEVLVNLDEVNHFHKDYRKEGEKWTVPKLDVQLKAFQAAKEYAEKNEVKIINASRNTKLEVFQKVKLEDIL